MIKRIRFVSRRAHLSPDAFQTAWLELVGLAQNAPADARPARVVACIVLHHVDGTAAPHDGMSMEWFEDDAALQRFEAWLSAEEAHGASVVEPEATLVVRAEEVVMRGAEWLERRWTHRAVKLKHMALARRAYGLYHAEFSARWRGRAGRVGVSGRAPVIIPEAARGHAYVQNHPLSNTGYDAINEVYFDDLEAMRARIAFFRKHDVASADADLVREAKFAAVSEHLMRSHMR